MFAEAISMALAACAEVRAGYPLRGALVTAGNGGVPVIQMKDIDPACGLRWAGAARVALTGRKDPDWLVAGDLLFVPRGSRFFAVDINAPPERAICSPHLFHLRVRSPKQVLPAFLAWQINQPPVQRQLMAAAEGSAQLSVRRAEIESLRIALPPLDQQAGVVALAQAARRERVLLMQLIENRERELAGLASQLAGAAGIPTT